MHKPLYTHEIVEHSLEAHDVILNIQLNILAFFYYLLCSYCLKIYFNKLHTLSQSSITRIWKVDFQILYQNIFNIGLVLKFFSVGTQKYSNGSQIELLAQKLRKF